MNIAILGWGSLIWNPKNLKVESRWYSEGPLLPIEFARISKDSRLTLVLCPDAKNVQTLWAYSSYKDLEHAIENLQKREETPDPQKIGYVSIPTDTRRCEVVPAIFNVIHIWATEKSIDAVIWTDLPQNFKEKTQMELNEENVIKYLRSLKGKKLSNAKKYIKKAPKQIATKLRRSIEMQLGW